MRVQRKRISTNFTFVHFYTWINITHMFEETSLLIRAVKSVTNSIMDRSGTKRRVIEEDSESQSQNNTPKPPVFEVYATDAIQDEQEAPMKSRREIHDVESEVQEDNEFEEAHDSQTTVDIVDSKSAELIVPKSEVVEATSSDKEHKKKAKNKPKKKHDINVKAEGMDVDNPKKPEKSKEKPKKQKKPKEKSVDKGKQESKGTRKPKQRAVPESKKAPKRSQNAESMYNAIIRSQKNDKPMLSKAPFERVVRDIAFDTCKNFGMDSGVRFQRSALQSIQTAAEQFIHSVFRRGIILLHYKDKVTLNLSTLSTSLKLHPVWCVLFKNNIARIDKRHEDWMKEQRENRARKQKTPKKSGESEKSKEFVLEKKTRRVVEDE